MHCLLLNYEVCPIGFGLIYNAVYKHFRSELNKLQKKTLHFGILCAAAIQSTHVLILFILYRLYILIDRRAGVNSDGSELRWVH
jgi:hypothetical protein